MTSLNLKLQIFEMHKFRTEMREMRVKRNLKWKWNFNFLFTWNMWNSWKKDLYQQHRLIQPLVNQHNPLKSTTISFGHTPFTSNVKSNPKCKPLQNLTENLNVFFVRINQCCTQRKHFVQEVNNKETIAAIEASNDTIVFKKRIEKFPL